jgi:hypothetical protein
MKRREAMNWEDVVKRDEEFCARTMRALEERCRQWLERDKLNDGTREIDLLMGAARDLVREHCERTGEPDFWLEELLYSVERGFDFDLTRENARWVQNKLRELASRIVVDAAA